MSIDLLMLDQVRARTGIPQSTLYRWMKESAFPQSLKLGARSVAWRSDVIDAWLAQHGRRTSSFAA